MKLLAKATKELGLLAESDKAKAEKGLETDPLVKLKKLRSYTGSLDAIGKGQFSFPDIERGVESLRTQYNEGKTSTWGKYTEALKKFCDAPYAGEKFRTPLWMN